MNSGRVLRMGERGMDLIVACRDGQLTRRELARIVSDEGLPELFAMLCLDYLMGQERFR